jgi:hypothetical protein
MRRTNKNPVRLFLALFILLVTGGFYNSVHAADPQTFWKYQCVDTMKDSRDNARNWANRADLPQLVAGEISTIKAMGANCVAIGTPYDDEFIPYLKVWVNQAHGQGLRVWFRGNLSGWEGWFSYPILNSTSEHNQKIARFINNNPGLFHDGDIFTPAPEPEQGKVIGDPRDSDAQKTEYLKFLVDSYNNCVLAFSLINIKVTCGYFSTNGDIAKNILTPEVVAQIGNVVVVDHYVASPETLVNDLVALHDKFNVKVMLGEFGAPIPDINGNMTESQQAEFIDGVLSGLVQHQDIIEGVNYWTLANSSTALLNNDSSPKKAVDVIKHYYIPAQVKGTVATKTGKKISGAKVVSASGSGQTITDQNGQYSLSLPAGKTELEINSHAYQLATATVNLKSGQQVSQNVTLVPKGGWLGNTWQWIKNLFGF